MICIIAEDEARRTLKVTTQFNIQDADSNLSRDISSNVRMLRYKRINSFLFTDAFFGKKRARGHICMQLFVSEKLFFKVYSMKSKAQFPQAVMFSQKKLVCPLLLLFTHQGSKHWLLFVHSSIRLVKHCASLRIIPIMQIVLMYTLDCLRNLCIRL